MAIFKKNESPAPKQRERPASLRSNQGDGALSIIGPGMLVVGDIATDGTVRVEGEVRGTIRAAKSVVLGQGGLVDGDIITEDAVIGGTVSGSINAAQRLELQSSCYVTGQIRTRAEHLKLEQGARFTGQVEVLEQEDIAAADSDLSSASTASRGLTAKPSDDDERLDADREAGRAQHETRAAS